MSSGLTRSTDIVFLQAPLGRREPLVYPLGIVTLAGCLPETGRIRVLDPNKDGTDHVLDVLKNDSPQVVCLSIRNLDSQIRRDLFYYYLHLKTFIRELRSAVPHGTLIAGGSGFSLFPRRIMIDNPGLDLGVFLEADETFPALVHCLDAPETVSGVYYRKNGEVMYTGDPPLPAPEAFGRPRYDLLHPGAYQDNGGVGIQTKRGCPLNCIYCTYPHLNGQCLRMLPVDRVMEEMDSLENRYGVTEVTFVDGVFNIPRSRTVELLHAKQAAGLRMKWRGWFTEKGFDREFAELCRDTGCPEFSFSPDGFSEKTLKALGKTIAMGDIRNVFETARETDGIRVAFNFFWNPPGQTFGAWLRMLLFAVRCKAVLGRKAGGVIFSNARIEPHTPLHRMAVEHGIIDASTDLLPDDPAGLERVFYSNRSTRYLDMLYSVYTGLWKLKQRLKHR
ncbi:MAG TPA: radical SAM protein [bacterium]|nr:radical SAM protein [bacterium]